MTQPKQPPQWGLVPVDADHVHVVAADGEFLDGLHSHLRGEGFECEVVPGPLPVTLGSTRYEAARAIRVRGWSRRVVESIIRYQFA